MAQPARFDYLTDPAAIYRQSFGAIRDEADLERFSSSEAAVAVRVIHACGMVEIAADLRFSGTVTERAGAAINERAPIFVDCAMVGAAIARRHLAHENQIVCTISEPRTFALAKQRQTTRSAAQVDLWADRLAGAVVVIGNAPTCLFALLELIAGGGPRPAAMFAFPVGFVGAAASKQALVDAGLDIPFVTLLGRRGGSAMAGAALNAVLIGARDQ
jgi:precorrin-8X/cobalt-precorrin-8 methylmutase